MPQARHHNAGTFVDASLQAARGGELQHQFLLSDLPRIREHAADSKATATLVASFSKVDQHVVIDGSVSATLQLTCQRCLCPVLVDVDDVFNIVVVASESELEKLSESQDAIVSDPSRLDIAGLTEEQLLLAIPLVPLHATVEQCELISAAKDLVVPDSSEHEAEVDVEPKAVSTTQQPFAALRDMMKKN